jgi:DNA invertase Pin-like site-specific DNA recombinase
MTEKLTGRYISYKRFSSPTQATGDSLRRQKKLLDEFLNDHNLVHDRTEEDEKTSSFREKNAKTGGLKKILDLIAEGHFKSGDDQYYIIMESLDRLSRAEILKSVSLFIQIITSGVNIITLFDRHVYTKNADIESVNRAIGALSRAYDESAHKSKRQKELFDNKKEKAKRGFLITKKCPAWLRVVETGRICPITLEMDKIELPERVFEVIPERVNIIKEIINLSIGGYGKKRICDYLNEKSYKSFSGGIFDTTYVMRLMKDRRLIGYFQPGKYVTNEDTGKQVRVNDGGEIPNYYPPIIEEAIFNECVELVNKRKFKKKTCRC